MSHEDRDRRLRLDILDQLLMRGRQSASSAARHIRKCPHYIAHERLFDLADEGLVKRTQSQVRPSEQGHKGGRDMFDITDAGLAHLKALPLTTLVLNGCIHLTDAGMAHL